MRLPIRTRLTLVSGALILAVLVATAAFVYLRLEAELAAAVDAGLRSRAEALLQMQDLPGGAWLSDPTDAFGQLLARDGRVRSSSDGLAPGPLLPVGDIRGLRGARFFDVEARTVDEPVAARLLAVPTPDGGVLVVGAALDDQREALAALLGLLALAGPVAVAAGSGVGWLVAGAALRPVERMRVEAEAVSGSEPGRRLTMAATGDELARLGESLNRMLGRLEDAADRERRFVDDASHELRTPLANLRAELELALRGARTPENLVAALRSAAEESERLTRLAEDLLVLARADRGRLPVHRDEVDVARLISDTVASFSARAGTLGIVVEARLEDARAKVDVARVRQAVGNLVDNALRYTPAGGRVQVSLRRHGHQLEVAVADTGEGFPPELLRTAFEPFRRAGGGREHGCGLGLAIVRAVAEAHGGSVEAANRPGGGATVVLRVPA